jgi:hypothetical protein
MNNLPPADFLGALKGLRSQTVAAAATPKRTVELFGKTMEEGWGAVKVPKSYEDKPRDQWKKKDVIWYFKNRYMEQFGVSVDVPLLAGYQQLETISYQIYKATGIDCTMAQLADFIDWCFSRHVNEMIQREGQFSLYKLTRPKLVLAYCKTIAAPATVHEALPAPIADTTAEADASLVTLDDLNGAFRIHSQYFVSNYGIILPVNFLMYVKKKSKEDAVKYVMNAISKMPTRDAEKLAKEATLKHAPYPTWFAFQQAGEIFPGFQVPTVDSNKYSFLKIA